MTAGADTPHLPHLAAIDSYGNGGFRFAEMSHRGSLLCLPSGIRAWPVTESSAISAGSLAPVFAEAGEIDILIVGTGAAPWALPAELRSRLRAAGVSGFEVAPTGPAIRIYNIVLAERRRLAAALIAVD